MRAPFESGGSPVLGEFGHAPQRLLQEPLGPGAASESGGSVAAPPADGAGLHLVDLRRGQIARVEALGVEHGLRHRLQALGLRPGQQLHVLRRAPWGGPIHVQVGMTELMLRRRDAARIAVTALTSPR